MSGLPGYDAWKLATPPEYEREEEDAPPAQRRCIPSRQHYCPEWDEMLIDDSMPEFEACLCYPQEEDITW